MRLLLCTYILLGVFIFSGCSPLAPMQREQRISLLALTYSLDSLSDILVLDYGTLFIDTSGGAQAQMRNGENKLRAQIYNSSLDNLSQLISQIRSSKVRLLFQRYIIYSRNLLLLSVNPNLNLPAFTATLSALSECRAACNGGKW
jgi:hypothetical protein